MVKKMTDKLYRIEITGNIENPNMSGSAMLYCDSGIAFVKLHPVRISAKPKAAHAKWEDVQDFGGVCFGRCSHCHTVQKEISAMALKTSHKFCSWCGAIMDEEEQK